ncbi:MAG: SMC-Scp complex subunit ScpB [Candidatus Heimdallarchaeota archaeon]|nr:MAG: SMC-Scp complex subunit ScpB [Candidatus Heimdallarchaeota archaeon]
MFRLFRRRKKDKKIEKVIEEKSDTVEPELSPISETSAISPEESQVDTIIDSPAEIPFEERFAGIPKVITDTISEDFDVIEPIQDFVPFAQTIVENEVTINSFISPELFIESVDSKPGSYDSSVVSPLAELPPISLDERIEGALFSVGRPIHAIELIEGLQEESPLVKRTLRKLSRRRKKSSPIVIEEISKDRWVLQLNPIYHEFFDSLTPSKFMSVEERRILTEIAYRQPISLGMLKKIIRKIGPVKITEVCKQLEENGYVTSEKRARSLVYSTLPKFAQDFGFDDESRRLKLQMLWRLKRLSGFDDGSEEEELPEELESELDEQPTETPPEDEAPELPVEAPPDEPETEPPEPPIEAPPDEPETEPPEPPIEAPPDEPETEPPEPPIEAPPDEPETEPPEPPIEAPPDEPETEPAEPPVEDLPDEPEAN